jgi:hypothetical protein
MTKFRELKIGDAFDFVSPDSRLNSFYLRCRKMSARKYTAEDGFTYLVGSVDAKVYNVVAAETIRAAIDQAYEGGSDASS